MVISGVWLVVLHRKVKNRACNVI